MIKIIISSIAFLLVLQLGYSKPTAEENEMHQVSEVMLSPSHPTLSSSEFEAPMSTFHAQKLLSKTVVFIVFIGFILLYHALKNYAANTQIILHYLACTTLTSVLFIGLQ